MSYQIRERLGASQRQGDVQKRGNDSDQYPVQDEARCEPSPDPESEQETRHQGRRRHDVEQGVLADEIPGIANHHFREDVSDSRMTFDYKFRSGPCPTTNALRIMEMEGLPVGQVASSE